MAFHEHMIGDLLEDPTGGLVVLSSGLCLSKLISSLLLLHHSSEGTLLILSSSLTLKTLILHHTSLAITEITADLPAHHRLSLYFSGQICFVTARILIVDLLTNKVPVTSLAGLILPHVHSVSETSIEAFIVRLVKSTSGSIYVRAFTDKPVSMVSGFSKTERIMRCLDVKRLHLWPRFQVYVSQELEKNPAEVVNLRIPMSKYMTGIQKAIMEVMDACLKEMRKTNKVDVDDLTVENGLFKSFDEIVRRQLDPIWHALGKKTKQLVADLRTLRKLLDYLVRYDAVSYLKYLDTLRASESFRSVWIFAESSYKIFDYAKKRVYRLERLPDSETTVGAGKKRERKETDNGEEVIDDTRANDHVKLEEVLEEAPKWKALREILEEIEAERRDTASEQDTADAKGDSMVLVACKDECSCMQLEDCINNGAQKVMREEWEKYLLSKTEFRGLDAPQRKRFKPKESKGFGVLDGVVHIAPPQAAETSNGSKTECRALLKAAANVRKRANHDQTHEPDGAPLEGATAGNGKPLPPLHFYAMESGQPILDVLKPSWIIVYHPSMSFVREIEVYGAENPSRRLKVYFLFYEGSTEVQKFEASIRRENSAFESLIKQKSLMMIPVDKNRHCFGMDELEDLQPSSSHNSITRKAGGRREAEKGMQVIVDMREFMSSLPNVLHQKGMRIIPVTLEVGDYVLSPLICVERKSIQDLFTSFSSGRLYHQVEAMVRHYRIPVLLIEFSQDKSFSFQSASEIGDDVTPSTIISKLSLLVLHFPKIRIIWSRSLYATADIFASLKANQNEPDESIAVRIGVPSEECDTSEIRTEIFNTTAVEFLRRLPGVTDANYRGIMNGCVGLAELGVMPIEKLADIMGSQKAARTLRDFLDAKYPTLL